MFNEGILGSTDVAPEARTSPVFARLKADTPMTNTAVAIKMTPMRAARFVTALRMTIGTNRRAMTSQAITDRVTVVMADPVRMKTWPSRLTFLCGCCRCSIVITWDTGEQKQDMPTPHESEHRV